MNKVCLVTGSSRGIGAATAKLLATQGFAVCVHYHQNKKAAEAVYQEIKEAGGTARVFQADLTVEDDTIRLFTQIDTVFGKLDCLVNNAAILQPQSKLVDMTMQPLTNMFNTNVTSVFLCCREALKRMIPAQHGNIVNISSGAATSGSPNEYIDYAASKGAIDTMTKGLSREVAEYNIRVNAVRPGFIYTDMHADGGEPERVERLKPTIPLRRGGQPSEVAEAIAWLISDKSSFCTGTIIDVTGGK